MAVTSPSWAPEYRRIADFYRDLILRGKLQPGQMLPPQRDMMSQHGVSISTIRGAMDLLRGEGLIDTARGKGAMVRIPPAVRVVSSNRYVEQLRLINAGDHSTADSAFARDHGSHTRDTDIDCVFDAVPAPEHVANAFGIEPGAPVFRRHMVWRIDGLAEQLRTCYHPLDLVQGTPMSDPAQQPYPGGVIAELAALGEVVDDIVERIRTRMALPDEAMLLNVSGGVPLLVVHRTGTSRTGRVVEVAELLFPGDRNELEYHLRLDQP